MPNWKKVITSGSDAALNSLNVTTSLTASGLIYPSSDNGEESFIQTDGNGNLSLQYVKTIYEEVVNGETTNIVKGTPVYVSGSVGAAAKVFRADAGNTSKMPVIYVTADTIAPAATGRGIALGLIAGVNTTGYPAGTEIYVAVGGGWTSTRPTGSAIVQTLGYVTKEGAGGMGVILNPGPNNLPNLPAGNVWVGNSNALPVATATSSIQNVVSASFATTAGSTTAVAGTTNYVSKFTSGTTIGNSQIFDNGTNVGIGTTSPSQKLDVNGSGRFTSDLVISGSITASGSAIHQIIGNTYFTTPATAGGNVMIVSLNNQPTLTFSQAGTAARLQITVIGGSQEQTLFKSFVSSGEFNWLNNQTNYLGRLTRNGNLLLPGSGSTTQPTDAGFRLDVNGTARVSGNTQITGSLNVAGTTRLSGSFNTAISGSILTVQGSGSAQPILTVQGSQGELFSVTDSLSGSLFSVNDISGLPILEVFSDNTTLLGNYQDPMLITTAKVIQTNSGSFTMYSLPTESYDTAFFEYSVRSGSNARAGTIMAIQSGSAVNFTETTTTDFGSTSAISFAVVVTGSNMALTGSSTSGAWTIKTIVRGI